MQVFRAGPVRKFPSHLLTHIDVSAFSGMKRSPHLCLANYEKKKIHRAHLTSDFDFFLFLSKTVVTGKGFMSFYLLLAL